MTETLSLRAALHGIWQAAKYPIRSNEDWAVGARLDSEALERASTAAPVAGDIPEFAQWIAALRDPRLPQNEREQIMSAVYDLFEPERTA